MILKNVLEAINSKFKTSDDWDFESLGKDVSYITFSDNDDEPCGHCVYDNNTQAVRYLSLEVPGYPQAFQWIDPSCKEAYCKELGEDWNVAFDNVNFTVVDTEELILEYTRDIVGTYYDNLPIVESTIPYKAFEEQANTTASLERFKDLNNVKNYTVRLDVRYDFDIQASSMDEAVTKARAFHSTMKHSWGTEPNVCWMDTEIIKETVEHDVV